MATEYLNNKAFTAMIHRFRDAKEKLEKSNSKKNKKEFEESQLELATAFYTLANNIIRAFKFNMIDKDDALQEGVLICFDKLHRFDENRGNCFAFFTQIQCNHYKQLYRTAKNYNELKVRYLKHIISKNKEMSKIKSRKKHNNHKKYENDD